MSRDAAAAAALAARLLERRVADSVLLRPDWPAPPAVRSCSTLRRGLEVGVSAPPFDAFNLGAHAGDDHAAVAHNREALRWLAALPGPVHWLRQVHGVAVHRVGAGTDPAAAVEADAAVTDAPGQVLAVLTADCLPVLLCDRLGTCVGAAHAGWRGLAAGVLEATVAAMPAPADRLLAWLGPAAGPAHYEIGEEVRAAFVDPDAGAAAAFVPTRPGHWRVDLYALARRRLAAAGVTAVSGGDRCTLGEPGAFFSYRRDGRTGRMAHLAWIQPEA